MARKSIGNGLLEWIGSNSKRLGKTTKEAAATNPALQPSADRRGLGKRRAVPAKAVCPSRALSKYRRMGELMFAPGASVLMVAPVDGVNEVPKNREPAKEGAWDTEVLILRRCNRIQ